VLGPLDEGLPRDSRGLKAEDRVIVDGLQAPGRRQGQSASGSRAGWRQDR